MKKLTELFFKSENIDFYSSLPLSECKILKPHLLPRGVTHVLVFLIPYYKKNNEKTLFSNISVYAQSRDYHLYFDGLKNKFLNILSKNGHNTQNLHFFCDHSPIDEVSAASKCGLGLIGKNKLLINDNYKSWVFIGEIFSDVELSDISVKDISFCNSCNRCIENCDFLANKSQFCMSALTQSKNLSQDQLNLLKKHPLIWGCDNCQLICPMCQNPQETPIEFFKNNIISNITKEALEKMSDSEFSKRAFSWKGKEVLLRNLKLK